jgi:hypothetical protein
MNTAFFVTLGIKVTHKIECEEECRDLVELEYDFCGWQRLLLVLRSKVLRIMFVKWRNIVSLSYSLFLLS